MDINTLQEALLKSWGYDTAMNRNWLPEVPSLNQCAVTALVVQDYLGGDLLRCKLDDGDSHYWNRLPDGTEIDLTAAQFEYTKQKDVGETIIRDREYVLSFPDTLKRYEILKSKVHENIILKQLGY